MSDKAVLIGLDGATWNILTPLLEQGKLPNLKTIMDSGASGTMTSVIPPVTAPAWMSMATGKNPGKTGVYDFASKRGGTYDVGFVDSGSYRRNGAIWDHVNRGGGRAIVLNYPLLFPPYPINGLMVSGIPSPESDTICYPTSLRQRLDKVAGGYEISVPYHNPKYNDRELFLKDLNRVLDKRTRVALDLLDEPWDLFIVIFSGSDWLQHLMWGVEGKEKEGVDQIWAKLDSAVAQIMDKAGKDPNYLIVSDHGFGYQKGVFNLPMWLEMKGYMKFERQSSSASTVSKLRETALYQSIKGIIPKGMRKKALANLRKKPRIEIDYSTSNLYVCNHSIPFGGIYINLKGRDPEGIVDPSEAPALLEQVKKDLKNLSQDIGKDVEVTIFDKNDVYTGVGKDAGPDIVFTINNWSCVVNNSEIDDVLYRDEPYSDQHIGSHRSEGIVMAIGPDIQKGFKMDSTSLCDVAPTLLHLMGLPVPKDIDGRVWNEIFEFESDSESRMQRRRKKAEQTRIRQRLARLRRENRI